MSRKPKNRHEKRLALARGKSQSRALTTKPTSSSSAVLQLNIYESVLGAFSSQDLARAAAHEKANRRLIEAMRLFTSRDRAAQLRGLRQYIMAGAEAFASEAIWFDASCLAWAAVDEIDDLLDGRASGLFQPIEESGKATTPARDLRARLFVVLAGYAAYLLQPGPKRSYPAAYATVITALDAELGKHRTNWTFDHFWPGDDESESGEAEDISMKDAALLRSGRRCNRWRMDRWEKTLSRDSERGRALDAAFYQPIKRRLEKSQGSDLDRDFQRLVHQSVAYILTAATRPEPKQEPASDAGISTSQPKGAIRLVAS